MTSLPGQVKARLQHKLAVRVTLGSLAFALVAGALLFWTEFQRQHAEAKGLQDQLAATVKSSASVAAYVKNEEIARDVIAGLISNPMVAAASIETDAGVQVSASRQKGLGASPHPEVTRYPLASPLNPQEIAGHLVIEQNHQHVNDRAFGAARRQAAVLVVQIGISAILLIVLFEFGVARPLNLVAGSVQAAVPGSAAQLAVPEGHDDDEIGSLVHSANTLLATTRQTLIDERALRAKVEAMEEQYRHIFETTNVGIMVLNRDGELINTNPALLSRIVGLRLGGLQDSERAKFIDTIFAQPDVVWGLIAEALEHRRSASEDCQLRTPDGVVRWAHCIISVVVDQENQIELIEGVLYDVTGRKTEEEHARRLADHDALTGLHNRRGMEFFLDRSLRHASQDGQYVGVLMIDLDGFKLINDTHGHLAGDQVLKGVASRMLTRIRRSSDLVARQGGDEFLVVATNCGADPKAVEELATDLVRLLAEPFSIDGEHRVNIGASIGIARYPTDGHTRVQLLAAADTAMYAAKQAGKNRYTLATATPQVQA